MEDDNVEQLNHSPTIFQLRAFAGFISQKTDMVHALASVFWEKNMVFYRVWVFFITIRLL